ncbi:MAG: hydroxyacylglutathione hydrolase [Pseudomonadota bacterium]
MLQIHQFPCLSDNYGFLVHDSETGETLCIDTPDGDVYLKEAEAKGWKITEIWNTHWHPDHTGGNLTIKSATDCKIIGPSGEASKIPGIDDKASGGDTLSFGSRSVGILDVPGHTIGHIAFHFANDNIAFVGDSVFALGCGRIFEGTPEMMWESMLTVRSLPAATTLYCAHEYTAGNAKFATMIDPSNQALAAYAEEIADKRSRGEFTVPTSLDREIATNPFLRADDPALQTAMGHPGDATATFAEIRRRKDDF